jgi:hypothetical protein
MRMQNAAGIHLTCLSLIIVVILSANLVELFNILSARSKPGRSTMASFLLTSRHNNGDGCLTIFRIRFEDRVPLREKSPHVAGQPDFVNNFA